MYSREYPHPHQHPLTRTISNNTRKENCYQFIEKTIYLSLFRQSRMNRNGIQRSLYIFEMEMTQYTNRWKSTTINIFSLSIFPFSIDKDYHHHDDMKNEFTILTIYYTSIIHMLSSLTAWRSAPCPSSNCYHITALANQPSRREKAQQNNSRPWSSPMYTA